MIWIAARSWVVPVLSSYRSVLTSPVLTSSYPDHFLFLYRTNTVIWIHASALFPGCSLFAFFFCFAALVGAARPPFVYEAGAEPPVRHSLGPRDAHDAQLARLPLRGDVHCRVSALAKAAAESDVDVGGGGPLSRRTRMLVAADAGCTGSAFHRLGTQWLGVSRPPASRAAPGGQAAALLSCCGRRGRRLPTSSPSCRRRSHRPNEASDAAIPHAKSGC